MITLGMDVGTTHTKALALDIVTGCTLAIESAPTPMAHINIHSGYLFQQWRRMLYDDMDESAMYAEVATVPPGAEGVTFELTDYIRRGRLDEVPYDADRQTLMRAVFEGLARRSAAIIDEYESASGSPYEQILVAGHPTMIELLRRLRMATYSRPIAAVDEPESAAFGVAVMAAQAVDLPGADELVARRIAWIDDNNRSDRRSG